jgi:pyruvate/2-oxoglutarate dehydrogenase complex dihydrolipoamide dehydrogenase (E3) component
MCYLKIVTDVTQNEKVIGFHILAPNAGEITQGVALAVKIGVTKSQLDGTVGIHPTIAEVNLFNLNIYFNRNLPL